MKKLIASLCGVFALCAALVGCSGAASDSPEGTWDYDDATLAMYVGDDLTDDQVAAAKKLMFMNINKDGTVQYVMYGDVMDGTWEKADGGITITIEDESTFAKLSDGKLIIGEDQDAEENADTSEDVEIDADTSEDIEVVDDYDDTMVFVKASEVRAIPTEDEANEALSTLLGFDMGDIEVDEDFDESDYQAKELTEFDEPVSIADDDTCTIVVTGVGVNGIDDPGYNLSVTNKSDKAIYIAVGDFTVDGAEVLAYADETVEPGETRDVFLGFDAADLGDDSSAEALVSVVGTIEVDDDETIEEIATYDFSM